MSEIKMVKMNQVLLSGRITADPEVKYTAKGTPVCKFTLAVDKSSKDASGNWQNEAMFIDVVAWNETAEKLNTNAHKGSPLLIEGRIEARSYTNKDNAKVKVTEIVANYIQYLEKQQTEQRQEPADLPEPDVTSDDVPF